MSTPESNASRPHVALERERKRLANALHDGVAQDIAYLAMRTPLLRQAIEASDPTKALQYLDDLENALSSAQTGVRALIEEGRPEGGGADLQARLSTLCQRWTQRAGLSVSLLWEIEEPSLDQACVNEIMLIVGEALSNVHRHAQAKQARVQVLQRDAALELTVRDNGKGLPSARADGSAPRHFGMLIMQERATALGGHLEIAPEADGGTQVRLVLPLG